MNLGEIERRLATLATTVATLAAAARQNAEAAELRSLSDGELARLYREADADPAPLPAGMAGMSTSRLAAFYLEQP